MDFLVVHGYDAVRGVLKSLLEKAGHHVEVLPSLDNIVSILDSRESPFDTIVVHLKLIARDNLLAKIQNAIDQKKTKLWIISGSVDDSISALLLKRGVDKVIRIDDFIKELLP